MSRNPLSLFQKFQDGLDIVFLAKAENICSDADIVGRIGEHKIASLWQVHGNRVIRVRSETSRIEKADGLITDVPGLLLSVRAADCQPIIVYAPKHHVVGLMHVGWRGLVTRTIPAFFIKLREEWNISSQETFVGIGPSLRQCCAEYRDADHALRKSPGRFWKGDHVDLAGIADRQLRECGVLADHIERHPDCTCCHPEKYWTYRGGDREQVMTGHTNVLTAMLRKKVTK